MKDKIKKLAQLLTEAQELIEDTYIIGFSDKIVFDTPSIHIQDCLFMSEFKEFTKAICTPGKIKVSTIVNGCEIFAITTPEQLGFKYEITEVKL